MSEKIEARVIEIIDEFHLVVDAGEEAGVLRGFKVYLFSEAHDVTDPKTGEVLESIEPIRKARLEVTEVYKKGSLCESFERETFPPIFSTYYNITDQLKYFRTVKSMRALPIDKKEATGNWPSFQKIRVGDKAVIFPPKEEEEDEE